MKNIDYYNCTKTISLEHAPDQKTTVFKALSPQKLSPEKSVLVDIIIQAPNSAKEDITTSYLALSQKFLSPAKLQSLLSELEADGIIEHKSLKPRLNIPYPITHHCTSCGCSCMGQLVGPLSENEHARVLEAHAKLAQNSDFPGTINPIMKGIKPDHSVMHFLNFPQKTCLFLDKNHLCTIHANFGEAQKPAACRRFPLIGIATDAEIRIGIKPYCYANGDSLKPEPCGPDYVEHCQSDDTLSPILADLVESAAYRPILRDPSADAKDLAQACLQEAQILAWLRSDISPEDFMRKLVSIQSSKSIQHSPLSQRFYRSLSERFEHLSQSLAPELDKMGQNQHAEHCRMLAQCLKKPPQDIASADPNGEIWAFARLCLHQAVFLRESSRFPSLNLGVFGLSLGYIAAIQEPENAKTHLTAWFRIFAQTQAFTMLFPSPQAISTLISLL